MQRMNSKEPFVKATMCSSFPRAAPFVEHLQNFTEEKDQMIFFTCDVLLSHRGLSLNKINVSLNKINVFCLLITEYDITKKLKVKEKITSEILCLSIL